MSFVLDHLFHWIDGSKMTFTDWRAGEPNGDMTGEDAVEMYYTVGSSGTWNDLPPSYEKGFMCSHQRELIELPEVTFF